MKREYVHAPLHSVCGMAVPQLVWVNVEPGGSAPLPANISNCLACEMPIPPGTREDELFIRAAATSEDPKPQLRITKGKTYNTHGRVNDETTHDGLRLSLSTALRPAWKKTEINSSCHPQSAAKHFVL